VVDGRKIAELRLLLVKSLATRSTHGWVEWEELMEAVDPVLGELLALSEVGIRLRALLPGVPWPESLRSEELAVVGQTVCLAMRKLEALAAGFMEGL